MAELELQQVKCPSCKRVISSFSPFRSLVECPYCHNKAFNPLITAKKVPVPERIIKLSLTEDGFEKKLIDHLVNTDYVPADIFEHLTADKIFKAYLPMYLFEGIWLSSFQLKDGWENPRLSARLEPNNCWVNRHNMTLYSDGHPLGVPIAILMNTI